MNSNDPEERSIFELADAAFQQAAKKVIERAKATSTPIILWINNQPQECDPNQITLPTPAIEKLKTEN